MNNQEQNETKNILAGMLCGCCILLLIKYEDLIGYNNFSLVAYVLSLPLLGPLGIIATDENSEPVMSPFQSVVTILAYAIVGWIIGVPKAKLTIISWIAKAYFWLSVLGLLFLAVPYVQLGLTFFCYWYLVGENPFDLLNNSTSTSAAVIPNV